MTIEVVRRRKGEFNAGSGMYRVYCMACAGYTFGQGKSRYQSWWTALAGAERAAQHHQDVHVDKKGSNPIVMRPCISERAPFNNGDFEIVSSIPLYPKE